MNIIRFYNQNRRKIWSTVAIIIFGFIIIQLLNNMAKIQNEADSQKKKNNVNQETTFNDVVSYDKESESIISDNDVTGSKKNTNGSLIDNFFTYCVNHNPEEAYKLLSDNIKENMYQSEALFESLYYSSKFDGNKQYSFQSWTTGNNRDTYQVKIFDDMLSTGKTNSRYIEDYVTVVKEGDTYKLNINSYIGQERMNASAGNENVSIKVINKYIYKDYQIFDVIVTNNTNNKILLDTRERTNQTYLTDINDVEFEAVLYNNNEQDLLVDANQTKKVQIKFNVVERDDLELKSINFENILLNYEQYKLNIEDKKIGNIEVEF